MSEELASMSSSGEVQYALVEKHTIERPFGWVFFYNSKEFVETGIGRYRVYGNGPIIVNRFTGALESFRSGETTASIIAEYEARLAKGQG